MSENYIPTHLVFYALRMNLMDIMKPVLLDNQRINRSIIDHQPCQLQNMCVRLGLLLDILAVNRFSIVCPSTNIRLKDFFFFHSHLYWFCKLGAVAPYCEFLNIYASLYWTDTWNILSTGELRLCLAFSHFIYQWSGLNQFQEDYR